MIHIDQITRKIVCYINVELCIMACELIYIVKRTTICLHTFEDDVFMWKELLCYCGSPGIDKKNLWK